MKMSEAERKSWRGDLSKWQSPADLNEKLDKLLSKHGSYVLTDPRANSIFRDSHCAHAFAVLCGAQKVRLGANPPDFEIETAGTLQAYEVTEADTPDRKRGDEIKKSRGFPDTGKPSVKAFPEEMWLTPEIADIALRKASELKSFGEYEPHWGFLILLNPIEFGVHQQSIEALMADATEAAKDCFAEIWVLWKGSAYNTWINGARGTRIIGVPRQRTSRDASLG